MLEDIIEIIKYESEGAHVDFKSQEYKLGKYVKKNELLKDFSAMANHPSNKPKYILIGIKEENGMAAKFVDIEEPTDQAKYQQFIDEYIEPKINFKYIHFEYERTKLAAFIISNNHQRPYLFKKDVKRPSDQKIEFRVGAGYIRAGTSTRKLNRNDFEQIYRKRFESTDRKSDLKIYPNFFLIPQLYAFMIDFTIENISSKSIGFDAEMKIYNKKGVKVMKRFELENGNDQSGFSETYPQYFKPKIDSTILDLDISYYKDYTKISRLKKVNQNYSVEISQKDIVENIFLHEIFADNFRSGYVGGKLSIELVLRSDDFREGPLVRVFELDFETVPNNG